MLSHRQNQPAIKEIGIAYEQISPTARGTKNELGEKCRLIGYPGHLAEGIPDKHLLLTNN
jgi:hypothetical protein